MIIMVLRAHVLILYVRGALEGAHIRVYIGVCVCAFECLHVAHVRAGVCVCLQGHARGCDHEAACTCVYMCRAHLHGRACAGCTCGGGLANVRMCVCACVRVRLYMCH